MKSDFVGEVNTSTTVGVGDSETLDYWFDTETGKGIILIILHTEETTGTPQAHSITMQPITKIGTTAPLASRTLTGITEFPLPIYTGDDKPEEYTSKTPTSGDCHMCWMDTSLPWEGVKFTVAASSGAVATVKFKFYVYYD